jgi:DNA-binding PadR family transcriptional regulator
MNIKEQLLEIIRAKPGLTGEELHREVAQRSWAVLRLGKWVLFGPTYGSMYVALEELVREDLINRNRGEATSEGRRARGPLRFYPRLRDATADHAATF